MTWSTSSSANWASRQVTWTSSVQVTFVRLGSGLEADWSERRVPARDLPGPGRLCLGPFRWPARCVQCRALDRPIPVCFWSRHMHVGTHSESPERFCAFCALLTSRFATACTCLVHPSLPNASSLMWTEKQSKLHTDRCGIRSHKSQSVQDFRIALSGGEDMSFCHKHAFEKSVQKRAKHAFKKSVQNIDNITQGLLFKEIDARVTEFISGHSLSHLRLHFHFADNNVQSIRLSPNVALPNYRNDLCNFKFTPFMELTVLSRNTIFT